MVYMEWITIVLTLDLYIFHTRPYPLLNLVKNMYLDTGTTKAYSGLEKM